MYVDKSQGMHGFGAVGDDWWRSLGADTKLAIQNHIVDYLTSRGGSLNMAEMRAEAVSLLQSEGTRWPNEAMITEKITDMILAGCARPVAEGGGFVVEDPREGMVGRDYYCPATTRASYGASALADGRCPAGTGGVPVAAALLHVYIPEQHVMPSTTLGIAGRVVDSSRTPVSGARVDVGPVAGAIGGVGSFANVTTLADGRFSFVRPARTWSLVISKAGYQNVSIPTVVVTSTGITDLGDVTISAEELPCPAGQERDAAGNCVPIDVPCPAGEERDAAGNCVSTGGVDCTDEANAWMVACGGDGIYKGEAVEPWYKSPWVWVAGGLVLLVGGYTVYRAMRKGQ